MASDGTLPARTASNLARVVDCATSWSPGSGKMLRCCADMGAIERLRDAVQAGAHGRGGGIRHGFDHLLVDSQVTHGNAMAMPFHKTKRKDKVSHSSFLFSFR